MKMRHYILEGHTATPVGDILEWGRYFESADRRVAETDIGEVRVSTVFLGLDHRYHDDGPPMIFETMIFGGDHDECQWRYSTWLQAEAAHEQIVECLKNNIEPEIDWANIPLYFPDGLGFPIDMDWKNL